VNDSSWRDDKSRMLSSEEQDVLDHTVSEMSD
jgi:hypothetical protein